jgi:predicted nuclease of restriction endonuclease-like (RecB) superfamily
VVAGTDCGGTVWSSCETENSQTASANSSNAGSRRAQDRESIELAILARVFVLPWSAYVQLLSVKSEPARRFYEAEALRGGWSVRQLDRQISSQFYERVTLSQNKAAMSEKVGVPRAEDTVTPEQAIKDPFVLEFLGLKDEYSATEIEDALIGRMADFLLELGDDFTFVARQRRLRLDNSWFRVDILMFHRRLKCLVIVNMKVGDFSYADAGQMHMYLNYAREHWMKPGENPPVGLILCKHKGEAQAHYSLDGLPNMIMAGEYKTILPDEGVLVEEMSRTERALEARRIARRASQSGSADTSGNTETACEHAAATL